MSRMLALLLALSVTHAAPAAYAATPSKPAKPAPVKPAPAKPAKKDTSELMRHIRDYVPTMEKVRATRAASLALEEAVAKDPALQAEYADLLHGSDQTVTLAGEVARLEAHPHVLAFTRDRGLSTEDAVLLPAMLMFSGIEVMFLKKGQVPKPNEYVTQAQIDFRMQNMAEFQRYADEDQQKALARLKANLEAMQKAGPAK